MRKNMVERGRRQMTIPVCTLHIACWILKTTNTNSGYVILIAFPLQQWLHERASMLPCAYISCLSVFYILILRYKINMMICIFRVIWDVRFVVSVLFVVSYLYCPCYLRCCICSVRVICGVLFLVSVLFDVSYSCLCTTNVGRFSPSFFFNCFSELKKFSICVLAVVVSLCTVRNKTHF